MSDAQTVNVTLLDKDYQIACPPDERDSLFAAAKELDARMRVIRSSGNVIGLERIAIMAAINLCYELQKVSAASGDSSASGLERIAAKLDKALTP